jgi:glycosyltransferase involved in cell wall biosynthesis/GT2 family glycosyltransferase
MSRLLFVTTELHPELSGGAGVLVDTLARLLSPTREVEIVLATTEPAEPDPGRGIEVHRVEIPATGFRERSRALSDALAAIARPGDRIEIQDFEGIAFDTLLRRHELDLTRCLVTVRFHGPYDLLAPAMDTAPDDWELPSLMEQEAYRMADLVLVPAPGHVRTLIERYGVDADRVVVAPPPVAPLPRLERRPSARPVFAVVGRLGEMKGSQDAVAAALALLEEGVDLEVRFVGGDGWSPTTGTWMSQRLGSMIPNRFRGSFTFMGPVDRERLPEVLADATAVIAPGRFESFCLAAHEARRMGLPVVLPDLPAYEGLLDEHTGALVYDRTVNGLAGAMRRLATDPGLQASLASAPIPDPGDPLAAYATDPRPRHPRTQAGLATAAAQRMEAFMAAHLPPPGLRRRIYRFLPSDWLHRIRFLPWRLQQKLYDEATWHEELVRRHHARVAKQARERVEAVQRRIAAGDFPEVESPDVTFVVPVHDDVRYLGETLASIYEQTHPSWEVIVVDDGSTDPETRSHLEALDWPRLRVVRHETNRGLPAARNTGMRQARGRFFVPLDSDDEVEPTYLEEMIAALEANPRAAYAHCYARLYQDIDAIWITRPFNPYWQLLGNGVIGCVLLRRDAYEQVGGYDESMTLGNEDWEMWLRLMEAGWDQVLVPRVLFDYRKHGISMSVRTEARFEEGRRMVRDRHRGLYETAAFRACKERWYPLVTVVADTTDRPHPEVEAVTSVDGLLDTWGKYVADVRGLEEVPVDLLLEMAAALEDEPSAERAVTSGSPPLVLRRRWSLHDPGSGHAGVVAIPSPQPGGTGSLPDHLPRHGWSVPADAGRWGVPVQRHAPEESGTMPDPWEW